MMKKFLFCVGIVLAVAAVTLGVKLLVAPNALALEKGEEREYAALPLLVENEDDMSILYRNEVKRRVAAAEDFVSEEEEKFLEAQGYHVPNSSDGVVVHYDYTYCEELVAYYPVLYTDSNDSLIMLYTSEHGNVYARYIVERSVNYLGSYHNLHWNWYEYDTEAEAIDSFASCVLTYDQKRGEILEWRFGQVAATYNVPAGSVYAGHSHWEGYIFRSGSDVYTLYDAKVQVIAHAVKEVLVADYKYSSDAWSHPLFLMEDGSIKAYVTTMRVNGEKSDDPKYLVNIVTEGGYHK